MKRFLVPVAERVARSAHASQKDKSGEPYIDHLERVARTASAAAPETMRDIVRAVAWLHDSVEDTTVSIEALRSEGLPEVVLEAVEVMTRREDESLEEYIERVRFNPIARIVKAADIDDNMSPSRLTRLDNATRDRLIAKYRLSRKLLGLPEPT